MQPAPDIGTPGDLGFPEKFATFRDTQKRGLARIYEETLEGVPAPRFRGAQMVVGAGKTGYLFGIDRIRKQANPLHRTAVLTVTKQLQNQIMGDFGTLPDIRLIKGRNNYECDFSRDCESGAEAFCPSRRSELGCPYYADYMAATRSPLVVNNISYWVAIHKYGQGLGKFDTLVIDEAHSLLDALTDIATFRIPPHKGPQNEIERESIQDWQEYAKPRIEYLERELETAANEREQLRMRKELRALQSFAYAPPGAYVADVDRKGWATISPVWPADTAEQNLYLGIPEVLLLSGTLLPSMMETVGAAGPMANGTSRFETYPPEFDTRDWRVQLVDVGRIQHNMSSTVRSRWLSALCKTLAMHPDQKGLIHSVSYHRMQEIARILPTNLSRRLITHKPGEAEEAFDKLRRADYPAVLCTPAASTGVDFPEEDENFVVVPKMPRPDHTALPRLHAARSARNKRYAELEMMNAFCQSIGRKKRRSGQRSAVYVLDSHARYNLSKDNAGVTFPEWVSDLLDWGRKNDPEPHKIRFR